MYKLITLLTLLVSCASPTKYQKYKKQRGYQDRVVDKDLRAASFRGNEHTKKDEAELMAKFRATEICHEEGKNLTHILDVMDQSESKEYMRTSGFGPSYYYGMSPYYGRYYSGFGVGMNNVNYQTWKETYIYPNFEVFFECVNEVKGPDVFFRQVSSEEMKLLVRDLKGGLQVEKILDHSPNKKILSVGDVVLRANGDRVQTLLDIFHEAKKNPEVKLDILRDGEKRSVVLKCADISGIVKETQEDIIHSACQRNEIKDRPICK
jgi:hypothetical protein